MILAFLKHTINVALRNHAHAIYRDFFSFVNIENFTGKYLILFLFLLKKAVLTSTHNLCFGAKIRKIAKPLHTPQLLYKSGVYGGIHYTDMLSLWIGWSHVI